MDYAIVFLPLLGSLLSGFFGKILGDKLSQIITSLFVSLSSILSIFLFYQVAINHLYTNHKIFTWISSGGIHVDWSINIDPLTSIMLVAITLVSALVNIYSIGYMRHDLHKQRFISYLSFFICRFLFVVS